MQRKRPREREDRFHYRFLERYDMMEMSKILLFSVGVLLFFEMQAMNGINEEEMLMAGMLTALGSALRKESRKKRCTIQLLPGAKALRISDFGRKHDEYFYRRFRFRKHHLVQRLLRNSFLSYILTVIIFFKIIMCIALLVLSTCKRPL
jgi:hypothetical protein